MKVMNENKAVEDIPASRNQSVYNHFLMEEGVIVGDELGKVFSNKPHYHSEAMRGLTITQRGWCKKNRTYRDACYFYNGNVYFPIVAGEIETP